MREAGFLETSFRQSDTSGSPFLSDDACRLMSMRFAVSEKGKSTVIGEFAKWDDRVR